MPRGGARNRSGPTADPNSARSEKKKYTLTALPASGYEGPVPDFPIPPSEGMSEEQVERERDLWWDAWRSPQACAWSMQAWRNRIVAQYCRISAVVELEPGRSAALVGQLHRFRDQLGLTPAGLRDNGWAIAEEKVKLQPIPDAQEEAPKQHRRSREMAS